MSDHEFVVEHKVTYRGVSVPVEYHDSDYDEARVWQQAAFMAGVDEVLDGPVSAPKDTIEVSVYTTRDYTSMVADDVWHYTESKTLFLEPRGVYVESAYDPTDPYDTDFRWIGKRVVARSDFEVGGRP